MSERPSKGIVLRFLKDGPVEIMTRQVDFSVQEVTGPNGEKGEFPTMALITFRAESFREVEPGSDEWEFVVMQHVPGVGGVRRYTYVSGSDIFMIRATPKVL